MSNIAALQLNSKTENTKAKKIGELQLEPEIDYQKIQINRQNKNKKQVETKATTNGNVLTTNQEFGVNSENNILLSTDTKRESKNDNNNNKNINKPQSSVLVEEKSSDNDSIILRKRLQTNFQKDEDSEEESEEAKKKFFYENSNTNGNLNATQKMYYQCESGEILIQESKGCLICNKLINISELYTSMKCAHFICRKCLKRFYEEKIEEGSLNFKCPIFFCKHKYDLNTIRELVTEQHFNVIIGKSSQIKDMKEEIDLSNTISTGKTLSMDYMKKYSQKYVEDINTNEQFFYYNKCKYFFCQNCSEMALFGKSDTHFVKCLNCFYCICKYCLKKYEDGHMDISKSEHCKVYYRREDEDDDDSDNQRRKVGICSKILEVLLFTIIAYLALFCGIFCYLERFFFNMLSCGIIRRKRYVIVIIVAYLLTLIIFFCLFPIMTVTLPYYPIFTSIFG